MDVSKLVIGGAVITTVLQLNSDKYVVIVISMGLAITLCVVDNINFKKEINMRPTILLYTLIGGAALLAYILLYKTKKGRDWVDKHS